MQIMKNKIAFGCSSFLISLIFKWTFINGSALPSVDKTPNLFTSWEQPHDIKIRELRQEPCQTPHAFLQGYKKALR